MTEHIFDQDDIEVICNVAINKHYRELAINKYKELVLTTRDEQFALEHAIAYIRKLQAREQD